MRTFPIEYVRAQFPALSGQCGSKGRRIYLDNPAGTQLPQCVIDAITHALSKAASNYGGFFENSRNADEIKQGAHAAMADMLGTTVPEEIIFGPNMTTVTLHLSRSIGRLFSAGDEIIVTKMDHEGDVSPWLLMAEDHGLVVKWLPFNRETWRIEPEDLEALITDRTRFLALNYASNLTGSINDVTRLVDIARSSGVITFVDAVQLAPHVLIDVMKVRADFLVCSSYKFFGPHMGILWGRRALFDDLTAYKVRCASNQLPSKFETGTPQTELLAGITATVDYFADLGGQVGQQRTLDRRGRISDAFESARNYETTLVDRLISGLQSIRGITIHGITNPNRFEERVPTVAITHHSIEPSVIAKALAQKDICVWSGHNYAFEVVRHLGISEESGVVRLGLAHYNTVEEVDRTLSALDTASCLN